MLALFDSEFKDGEAAFVGRLDVRTKMGVSLLASVATIAMNQPAALGTLAVLSALYAASLKRFKALLIVYAIVAVMWCGALAMMSGLHLLWPAAPAADLEKLTVPFLRTAVMINVALALALSSRIQSLLAVMKSLRLPLCIYVPLAVMVRFIPTFIEDVRQIRECIYTRGYRITPVTTIRHPVLTIRLLLMPLLFRSLRSADELGIAAELKGMGYGRRIVPLREPRFHREDAVMAGLTLSALAVSVALQVAGGPPAGGMF